LKIVIFGLTVTSSWGNGHATLWRALLSALAELGHEVTFFERDVPYYAAHRDLHRSREYAIELYSSWSEVLPAAIEQVATADAAIVTSYCVDAVQACDLVVSSTAGKRVFYDLDTPVTLDRLRAGRPVEYLPPDGLGGFDLVLSYTGGKALDELSRMLDARAVAPLYGSADPKIYHPVSAAPEFVSDLSYLGTYASDRQHALEQLFLAPARALPARRFVIGGAQYPQDFPWSSNIWFVRHVPPPRHAQFYSSSELTLNVTRAAMAAMGYCPSGRLFEAAACAAPIVSDAWEGLDAFFEPGREILIVRTARDVIDAMRLSAAEKRSIGEAARARVLDCHTATRRAQELLQLLQSRDVSAAVCPGRAQREVIA
jgi:spore maturation protein CgeB